MYGRKSQKVAFTCLLSELYIHGILLCSEHLLPLETLLIIFWFISLRSILILSSCCHLVFHVIAKKLFIQELCFLLNYDFKKHKLCGTWSHIEWGWKLVCISITSVTKMNTVMFSSLLFLRSFKDLSKHWELLTQRHGTTSQKTSTTPL